ELQFRVLLDPLQRRRAVGRRTHQVAEFADRRYRVAPHIRVVLDDQHGFAGARPRRGWFTRVRLADLGRAVARQVQLDAGAAADLAVHRDVAARLLDEAVDLRQAE